MFNVFRNAVLCTKHPGFEEELEWRIIHQPSLVESRYLTRAIEVVRGIPQPVYKIKLDNSPVPGANLPDLITSIIIGPTRQPDAIAEAFMDALVTAGVADAHNRIITSTIPLRQ
jgi:hypothetical protein